MKSKYVILASALLISVASFAQKNEIKAAEKAFKKGNSQEAAAILQSTEALLSNASNDEKAQFFFVKGNAYLDLANKSVEVDKNLGVAADAYVNAVAAEKASGKSKYTDLAAKAIIEIKYKLINSAIADSKVDKHSESAQKLYDAYLLDKNDTINLYYAASTYVNAKEYDKALKNYEELKRLNYSGKGTSYFAVSKLTGEEDIFNTAAERDRMVKMATHEKPRTEPIPSKRGEIFKNMALILVDAGKIEEAKKAIAEARLANPEDTSLQITEANLYLDSKDFVTYKKIISEVLEKNPNDADLIFNLGVISANAKEVVEAEKYYKRAFEINPEYINAYLNLAILKLDAEKIIIEEMNKLGNSESDNKRYLVLKKQREDVFRGALPYLEKAYELQPKNEEVASTLLSVYGALEMTAKKNELKAKM